MGYGVFDSRDQYEEWMNSWRKTQEDISDLNHRLSIKKAELIAEGSSELAEQVFSEDHAQILDKAMSVLTQAVSLLSAILKRTKR